MDQAGSGSCRAALRGAQALRHGHGARRRRPRRAAGRAAGPARPERRRQEHGDWSAARPFRSRRRRSPPVRPIAACARRAPPRRRDAAERRHAGHAEGRRAARADAQLLPDPLERRRMRRDGRHRRSARAPLRQACPAGSSGACSSRSRSAGVRGCCSSTSRRSASTSKRARRCGRRCARSSPTAARCC